MSTDLPTRRGLLLRLYQAGDVVVMGVCFALAFLVSVPPAGLEDLRDILAMRVKLANLLLSAGLALSWHLLFRFGGLYRSRRIGRLLDEWWSVTKAVVLGTLLIAAAALLFDISFVDRRFLVVFLAAVLPATLSGRLALRLMLGEARRRGRNLRKVVIVGCGRRARYFAAKIRQRPETGYLLVGFVDDIPPPENPGNGRRERHLGSLDQLEELLTTLDIDEVFIALPVKSHYRTIARVIGLAEDLGLIVRLPADVFELRVASAAVSYLDEDPVLTLATPRPSALGRRLKRGIDVAGARAALVFLAPLLAVVALVIKLDSPGPVLFAQDRVGLDRRRFRMLKFRTMVANAEELQERLEHRNEVRGAAFKIRDDPRITRCGRLLRRYSIDELPQLFNVLRGDMSLVGPRPLPERDVEAFEARWEKRRFSVQPGLTCLWQANGRHQIGFDDWMELDLQYIDNWSLKLDFEILARTIPAVLHGAGAS